METIELVKNAEPFYEQLMKLDNEHLIMFALEQLIRSLPQNTVDVIAIKSALSARVIMAMSDFPNP